jgi:hypothetical protein
VVRGFSDKLIVGRICMASYFSNVPPRLQDGGARVGRRIEGGEMHRGGCVEEPPNFGDFREMGPRMSHIYNIKHINIKF